MYRRKLAGSSLLFGPRLNWQGKAVGLVSSEQSSGHRLVRRSGRDDPAHGASRGPKPWVKADLTPFVIQTGEHQLPTWAQEPRVRLVYNLFIFSYIDPINV